MQYPIIDLITDAYINNGWSGLDIIEGKNLYSRELSEYNVPVFAQDGSSVPYPDVAVFWLKVTPNTNYTVSYEPSPSGMTFYLRWINCTESKEFINRVSNIFTQASLPNTFITPSNCEWVQVAVNQFPIALISQNDWLIQIEQGTEATSYDPYKPPTTDIAHRLKLPLPHYFPHPVIDALQRADAGTQTADDTEILQHYLTPLGIGGI